MRTPTRSGPHGGVPQGDWQDDGGACHATRERAFATGRLSAPRPKLALRRPKRTQLTESTQSGIVERSSNRLRRKDALLLIHDRWRLDNPAYLEVLEYRLKAQMKGGPHAGELLGGL